MWQFPGRTTPAQNTKFFPVVRVVLECKGSLQVLSFLLIAQMEDGWSSSRRVGDGTDRLVNVYKSTFNLLCQEESIWEGWGRVEAAQMS